MDWVTGIYILCRKLPFLGLCILCVKMKTFLYKEESILPITKEMCFLPYLAWDHAP